MLNSIIKISYQAGLNQAVFTSLLARLWQITAGALTLFFVALYFSKEEQGYFYTFNSILGLQVIFEMGLSFVILQFSGHIFAHLKWGKDGIVEAEKDQALKFFLLLRNAFIWYAVAAIIMAIALLPAGFYFFNLKQSTVPVVWQMPWIVLVVCASCNLLTIPTLAAIEGSGQVASVNRLRLIQGIIGSIISWGLLVLGAGLWMAAAPLLVAFITSSYWILTYYPELIKSIVNSRYTQDRSEFSWKNEVWPMQWRIAVSWISGYFIFQLFTPVLFYYHGSVPAGKMGMSIAIATMLNSVGFVWLQASTPKLTKLAALKDWNEFDKVFFKVFLQSLVVVFLGSFCIATGLILLHGLSILERVLPLSEMIILLISFSISHIISGLAYYLRLHKREPFMLLSLIGAVLLSASILYFGRLYAERGMVLALLVVNIFYGLPTAIWLWSKLRKAWH